MKYYEGNELKWSTEDVLIRATDLDIDITEEDAERILISTFQDNDYIMEFLGQMVIENIKYYLENNELHKHTDRSHVP